MHPWTRNPTCSFVALLLGALLLTAATAGAGEPMSRPDPVISYTGPEDPKDRDPARFQFQAWEPGQILSLAVHDANLRKATHLKGEVLATLPMGAQVVVKKAVGAPVFVIGKRDRWYQVEVLAKGKPTGQVGYLFGMILTPAAFEADLDGDGEPEIITVSFSSDFKIRIRIREPGVDEPSHVTVDVNAAGGAYVSQRGGMARVALVDVRQAGVGLVRVDAFVEACADFATYWISYEVPGKARGVLGEARLAMTQAGISDPPVHSSFEVSFDAKTKTATVIRTESEEDENGKESVRKSTSHFELGGGIYREKKQPQP